MKNTNLYRTIAFLLSVFFSHSIASAQDSMQGYRLVWQDEFNTDGLPDTANWVYEQGFVRNEEFQWYQEENAFCKNGLLVIEARRENKPNPMYEHGSKDWRKSSPDIQYTSSSINTKGKHSWQYGRFVMRGRIDIRGGLWPAWWTLGVNGQWPANGEIDIMEYYRDSLLANIACAGTRPYKAFWYTTKHPVDSLGGTAWASQFHTWRMDWDEKAISLYVDDQLLNHVPLDSLVNRDGSGVNPFKQPHYMLLDFAIGGMNGGDPSGTAFPNRFEVDYVRVYEKQPEK
ncbi:glycoside hydrolase family 16 protein [Foetidibacter luteolus]|uniref:glycoside hydrolase family 16 protein n=1 Tax=Foetidibacter luteolus TaxID=2608880 RepID=UPI00129A449C|nr:glycoside hydrolase family 16 protein [Foetidibacter luteolus]